MSTTTDTQAASAQIPQNDSINTATADLELTSTHDPETHHRINRVIVIGLDHSKHSKEAFDWTVANLLRKESDLTVLVNVRPIPAIPGPYEPLFFKLYSAIGAHYMDFTEIITNLEEQYRLQSHQLLQEYAAILKAQNFACKAIAMRGDPRDEIVRKVSEVNANTLVIGSRGLGALKRTILGSVSDWCSHSCQCTVIIVKGQES